MTSPGRGSSDGEQHSTEAAASGSPPPVIPDGSQSSSSDSDRAPEAAERDPKAEEVPPEGGPVPAAPAGSDPGEGPGEVSTENVPQAVLSQVWLSYSRSMSYVSSDDTESEDEEIWEELQNLRQK